MIASVSVARRLYETVASTTRFTDDIDEAVELVLADPPDTIWQSLSNGEKASIMIALSLYGLRLPLDLRWCFTVMDHDHAEMCIDAMNETAGVE